MTDTTTTPAKRVRKTNPPAPAFDYTALKPKKVEPPKRKTASTVSGPNPTIPWLRASWTERTTVNGSELGSGQEVTIPTANLVQFRNLLNYAARDLGIGVTIKPRTVPGGKTVVTFAAKARKARKVNGAALQHGETRP